MSGIYDLPINFIMSVAQATQTSVVLTESLISVLLGEG
jgi:hypothetical protein